MSSAWSKIILENIGLKAALICMSVIAISLTMLLFVAAGREPLIIERACFSKVAQVTGAQQTKEEIETFLRLALSQRFDSEVRGAEFLDADLRELRTKEQKDLDARQMKQFVHVNSFRGDHGVFQADVDRIVTVGNIRSALRFPLTLKVSAIERSASNPYGLLLTDVDQEKESKNEK